MKGENFVKSEQAMRAMRMAEIQLSKPDLKSAIANLQTAIKIIKGIMEPKNVKSDVSGSRKVKNTSTEQ